MCQTKKVEKISRSFDLGKPGAYSKLLALYLFASTGELLFLLFVLPASKFYQFVGIFFMLALLSSFCAQ